MIEIPVVLVTDAKSVYDALTRRKNTAAAVDGKRTAIDLAVLRLELLRSNVHVRWVDTRWQLADPLTKRTKTDFLRGVMAEGRYRLVAEATALLDKAAQRGQQEQARGTEIVTRVSV